MEVPVDNICPDEKGSCEKAEKYYKNYSMSSGSSSSRWRSPSFTTFNSYLKCRWHGQRKGHRIESDKVKSHEITPNVFFFHPWHNWAHGFHGESLGYRHVEFFRSDDLLDWTTWFLSGNKNKPSKVTLVLKDNFFVQWTIIGPPFVDLNSVTTMWSVWGLSLGHTPLWSFLDVLTIVVCYESLNREVKTKPIYEFRCDERQKTKVEESTRLACTLLVGELEHLKIETRLIDEMFATIDHVPDWVNFFFFSNLIFKNNFF